MTVRHFTATAVVMNAQRQTLLLLHKKLNTWLPPGGHVEPNELPDDAALREIFEETGVRARFFFPAEGRFSDGHAAALHRPLAVLCEDIGGAGDHFHIDLVYLCRADEAAILASERETLGVRWFFEAELQALDMYDNTRAVLREGFAAYDAQRLEK